MLQSTVPVKQKYMKDSFFNNSIFFKSNLKNLYMPKIIIFEYLENKIYI
ncbi:hypothetical protein LEP1GSC008_3555 [Leptospira kirschneri serovar Bulgarica str. Nikolaevo]|uniref:Uncharacterized protein n=1 Tax=Leptospira kirschneri serovar Bulgarica str. Nikolaevo TaxID=1240687 RepID=M6FQQ9_9LEPT|nr:hypothetical protein LEP1GSC008_3555 [Leptospira kirschneri serovar Bulgarica str. Nikolaevo]